MVTGVVPEFRIVTRIVLLLRNCRFVMDTCSVAVKLNVSAPIHAATAMDTATVTAMSMMAATTGLSAFLLLKSFLILVCIPPYLSSQESKRQLDI